MATTIGKLTVRQVDTLPEGFHSDGGNLYLRVKGGSRAWVFRYKDKGRVREIGLGPTSIRKLKEVRVLAEAMRKTQADGRDPGELLRVNDPTETVSMTFEQCAQDLLEAKRSGWKNVKHAQQWINTLRDYAFPVIGTKAPADVTLADVKSILLPIWTTKTETATRVRQRIEAVLDYAAVHDLCDGTRNPARWKGILNKVLPEPGKVSKREHHAASAYTDIPRIMAALREKSHVSAYCLQFTILTAARSGESRGATWDEVDLDARVWTIPSVRMKAAKPHRVPLSDAAMKILTNMQEWRMRNNPKVFPGARGGLLSDVAVNKTLHSVITDVTVHGFRSSFRDWGAEQTNFPAAVLEQALAHTNPNKVEAAYQRSDLFELRRKLMQMWADFVDVTDQ
ncbi:tyrosine-type recombinase/integrase [Acidithiobacillus sp. HP-6]|jgi:integrase|uniref:tyrosine-type recombinase/integrase n=1 Tax=unclassified Acidithiobacillus TaxID=2614800 RepID=UPI00187B0924|nr:MULTISPECIES: site-specific integrase [unclassified Acidithiobacillus]MBE7562994.1 tyrosine-type recombinase/integrase [Acidithiobacillus sp. HP-6]MBE7567798.1 tyrosine-type recombinase/integrase [Acidithiobacillus sp. HP-11]MBE7569903.1 tyrosine-type recombinase/integrase [Acidithiobacillus sp. HP-2]